MREASPVPKRRHLGLHLRRSLDAKQIPGGATNALANADDQPGPLRSVWLADEQRHEAPRQWIQFAERHGLTTLGIGTDCFVVGNLLRTWFAPIAAAVNGRDQHQRVKKVYY